MSDVHYLGNYIQTNEKCKQTAEKSKLMYASHFGFTNIFLSYELLKWVMSIKKSCTMYISDIGNMIKLIVFQEVKKKFTFLKLRRKSIRDGICIVKSKLKEEMWFVSMNLTTLAWHVCHLWLYQHLTNVLCLIQMKS